MTADDPSLTLLRSKVRDVPDFPTPGILFRDITPLLSDHHAMDAALSLLAQAIEDLMFDVIAAPEHADSSLQRPSQGTSGSASHLFASRVSSPQQL